MADEDLERRVQHLERDHDLTRWYTGRVDRDLAEIGATQAEHTRLLVEHGKVLNEHTRILTEHGGRLDSIDAQLRSLTHMTGEVLAGQERTDAALASILRHLGLEGGE